MKWSDVTDNIKTWHIVVAFIILLCAGTFKLATVIYAFDQRKADKIELVGLSKQFQAFAIDQERAAIQKQIWEIEDRFQCGPRYGNTCFGIIQDKTICKTLLNLQEDLKRKQKSIEGLRGK